MSRNRNAPEAQLALPLTAKPRPRPKPTWTPSSDNDTSLEAAAHVAKTGIAGRILRQVLVALVAEDATDQQLEERLNISGNTIRPRRSDLVERGLAEHTGLFRPSPSGRRSKVYRATPAGVRAAQEASDGS